MRQSDDITDAFEYSINNAAETLEEEKCIVVFDIDKDIHLCFGPFDDNEEAETFIACGPHGLEEHTEHAHITVLYPPHTVNELLEVGL